MIVLLQQTYISVGIDIGTSTTQLIFSRITLENMASSYTVPQIKIVKKEMIYKSDIYFTPLLSPTEIDGEQVKNIISLEYYKIGILPQEVATGAVIITGETAKKQNADKVLEKISAYAGQFVVTTAGPALESVLSGRGACADKLSKELDSAVVNIDVGGGTSNLSAFDRGRLLGVSCLDIGGRLVKIDKRTEKITYISQKIKTLARLHGILFSDGETANINKLQELCGVMSDMLFAALGVCKKPPLYNEMFTENCTPPEFTKPPAYVCFSGGVADCIYNDNAEVLKYGDIGILLGREIRRRCEFYNLQLCRSRETIRATAIGAGMHTAELSGSTIFYTHFDRPVKNAAILKIPEECLPDAAEFIRSRLNYFETDGLPAETAIAFNGKGCTSFEQIQRLSQQIVDGAQPIIESNFPLILIAEQDIGKALGHAIDRRLKHKKDIICIDGIAILNGDYIDIGKPVAEGNAVPVVVKTLIFNS